MRGRLILGYGAVFGTMAVTAFVADLTRPTAVLVVGIALIAALCIETWAEGVGHA